jgi:hypothetical protein
MVATLPGSQSLGFTSEGEATVEAPSTRERRSARHEAAVAEEGAALEAAGAADGPLGEQHLDEGERHEDDAVHDELDVVLRKAGLSVEACEAHLDATFTRGGNLSVEGERGNPIGITDHVVGDIGGPLRQGVVGDGVGERVEEALVEGSSGDAAQGEVDEGR